MISWARAITGAQWKTLAASMLGWMLDGMDIMLYAFALETIKGEFGLSSAGAGALASVTLVASAAGGLLFGVLADRIGRARALMYSILTYSIFTALTATSGSVIELVLWRTLVGFGMGGEWSAGAVLVSETWPAQHRGKAIGLMQSGWALGYMLAAVCAGLILPVYGWRVLFLVGVLPALWAMWIRRHVPEPELWTVQRAVQKARAAPAGTVREMLRPPWRRRLVIATCTASCVLFAYWGLFTWIPAFLAAPPDKGGAGLGFVRSTLWVIPMQIGAFFGYSLFGFGADRFGRRPMFIGFLIAAAILVPPYSLVRTQAALMILGPLVGFFGHGYFSVFGSMLAELFPTHIRGTAQGLAYNAGRGLSALSPWIIGALADRGGFGAALGVTSGFFLAGAAMALLLPETRGVELASNPAED